MHAATGEAVYRLRVSTIIEFRGNFRCVEEGAGRLRARSRGKWVCRCGGYVDAVHDKPRCEVCRGGGDCGLDCTLSSLHCNSCGATFTAD
jgi:hypothetical protein